MNYSEEIFKMLGIKPNEWFKLKDYLDDKFQIDENLIVYSRAIHTSQEHILPDLLHSILIGSNIIIKIPKPTPNEQLAIDYAKACGCRWLAKDKNNEINAFVEKPLKSNVFGGWDFSDDNINTKFDYDCVEINIPISFISWDDEEPYYIGD